MDTRANYDALLLVSFGGPEGMDDVMPFLENVLRGRNVPLERMRAVAHHYELFDGVSPINQQNRNLIAALSAELQQNGPDLPIYWGNRNWHPFLSDTIRQMTLDGVKNALAFVTSAYSSYSSCRQYLENISNARLQAGDAAPTIEKIRAFYNHPLFIEANISQVRTALASFPPEANPALVFTAHSIPETMAAKCDYAAQLNEASRLVADALQIKDWALVYQSRSGSPTQPWLGPDVCDHLRKLKSRNASAAVIAPVGFVSDHMEVIYDLDFEAANVAKEIGLPIVRAATAGTHPLFTKMIRELILERVEQTPPRFLGGRTPTLGLCGLDECCQK